MQNYDSHEKLMDEREAVEKGDQARSPRRGVTGEYIYVLATS